MNILFVPAEMIIPRNQLSRNTLARCLKGLKAWQAGEFDFLMLSGGVFHEPSIQTKPASEIMKSRFVKHGVPKEVIITEITSVDTYENISNSLKILRDMSDDFSITVLTQFQHALRFQITFWFAHGIRINTITVKQPNMSWIGWILEWVILVPCHLTEPSGSHAGTNIND